MPETSVKPIAARTRGGGGNGAPVSDVIDDVVMAGSPTSSSRPFHAPQHHTSHHAGHAGAPAGFLQTQAAQNALGVGGAGAGEARALGGGGGGGSVQTTKQLKSAPNPNLVQYATHAQDAAATSAAHQRQTASGIVSQEAWVAKKTNDNGGASGMRMMHGNSGGTGFDVKLAEQQQQQARGGAALTKSNTKVGMGSHVDTTRQGPGNIDASMATTSSYDNQRNATKVAGLYHPQQQIQQIQQQQQQQQQQLEADTDSDKSEYSGSEEDTSWISWFCSLKGHEFFCEVDDEYIQDDFNLSGLASQVPYYDYALDLVLDVESPNDEMLTDEQHGIVESAAEMLYGLIHARYIVTSRGMNAMLDKFKNIDFGRCPRVLCQGQPCLPVGQSDIQRMSTVKVFCPKCGELYYPRAKYQGNVDGAYFGTTFPHLFCMTYPHLRPSPPTSTYVPKIFGFKVHSRAYATDTNTTKGSASTSSKKK